MKADATSENLTPSLASTRSSHLDDRRGSIGRRAFERYI